MATSSPAIVVERHQSDLDNQDHTTAQTVALMCDQIRKCAQDPAVQAAARNALIRYSQGRAGAYSACWAIWWSIRHALKFVSDARLLRAIRTPNPPELEELISPSVMVRARNPQGDCDDFTMLMCAFLECLGVPWEIVTIAEDPGDSQRWSHVYAVAYVDEARFAMDAAPPDAKYPGWEVPPDHILRYQAWDQDGRPVDRPRPVKRMGAYRPRRRGLRGLGQVCLNVDTDTGQCSSWSTDVAPTPTAPTGALNPSTTGTFWDKELATLLNSGATLAGRVFAPTTTYTTAQGQLVTPGGLPAGAMLLSGGSLGGISMNTILLLIGGVVLVFVLKK